MLLYSHIEISLQHDHLNHKSHCPEEHTSRLLKLLTPEFIRVYSSCGRCCEENHEMETKTMEKGNQKDIECRGKWNFKGGLYWLGG
jgi:hypothetical protein